MQQQNWLWNKVHRLKFQLPRIGELASTLQNHVWLKFLHFDLVCTYMSEPNFEHLLF